jgi:Neuraminidase (sialidase)
MTITDDNGHTWHKFTVSYRHEIDDQSFSFDIWAIDFADAVERLEFIKSNGKVDGKIL